MAIYRDEIQRIKASNPDITHREAFSAAAKNVNSSSLFSSACTWDLLISCQSIFAVCSILTKFNFPLFSATVGPFPTHPFRSHAGSGPEEDLYPKSGKILRRPNPNNILVYTVINRNLKANEHVCLRNTFNFLLRFVGGRWIHAFQGWSLCSCGGSGSRRRSIYHGHCSLLTFDRREMIYLCASAFIIC